MVPQGNTQSTKRPIIPEAKTLHGFPGILRWKLTELNFIQRGDQTGPVPADITMKVDRTKSFIGQNAKDVIDTFFRRGDRRCVDGCRDHNHAVGFRLVLLQAV